MSEPFTLVVRDDESQDELIRLYNLLAVAEAEVTRLRDGNLKLLEENVKLRAQTQVLIADLDFVKRKYAMVSNVSVGVTT